MKRRAIREELELIELLDADEHSVAKQRVQARVAVLLRQYEPDEDVVARRRELSMLAGELVGFVVVAVVAVAVLDLTSWWSSLLVGSVLGIGFNVTHWLMTSRREKAEQDDAVATVRLEGVLPRMQADFRMEASPPEE